MGWGKSTFSRLAVCRMLYELSCLKDPEKDNSKVTPNIYKKLIDSKDIVINNFRIICLKNDVDLKIVNVKYDVPKLQDFLLSYKCNQMANRLQEFEVGND